MDARRFVRVEDGALVLDGAPFRFVLANAYYLQEEAARGRVDRVDEVLGKLVALGVRVVRTWAFNDDPSKDSAIRRGLDRTEEVGLRGLDVVLDRARVHGVRLVLPLVNFWSAYGGTRQWCLWCTGSSVPPEEGDARFFTDERVREPFFAHVAALMDRVNTRNGVRYGDDETVLCWELMNEPRDPPDDWIAAMTSLLRARSSQLLSLGDEGHEPVFSRSLEHDLDLASAHFYPEQWGWPAGRERELGVRFMVERVERARRANRPLYVGELGLGNEGASFPRFTLPERRAHYRTWLAAAERLGMAGIGPWLFAHDDRPDAWDDFTFYCKTGTAPDDPVNRYADLLRDAAALLR